MAAPNANIVRQHRDERARFEAQMSHAMSEHEIEKVEYERAIPGSKERKTAHDRREFWISAPTWLVTVALYIAAVVLIHRRP